MFKSTLLLLLLLLSVNAASAITDTISYARQRFTDENGLPQNSVKNIVPDKAGFIWLATENGMVRYEGGNHFRIFNKNELNIASSRISYILPGAGQYELSAQTEQQEMLGITKGKICLQDAEETNRATYSYLVLKPWVTDTLSVTGLPSAFEKIIQANIVFQFPLDAHSCFMVHQDSVKLMKDRKEMLSFRFRNTSPWRFFMLGAQLHYLDEQGRLMVFEGTQARSVALSGDILRHPGFNERRSTMKIYWNLPAQETFLYLDKVCYLLQALPDGSVNTLRVLHDFDFERNRILSVYYDAAQARIFLGSTTRGLFIFSRQPFHVLNGGGDQDDEVYYAQTGIAGNRLITAQGIVFDTSGPVATLPLLKEKSAGGDRFSIVTDRQNNIWYKAGDMLYKFNSTATALLWKWKCPSGITRLYIGSDNRLWIGTTFNGLYALQTNDPMPSPLAFIHRLNDVSCMQQETPELLWLGAGKDLYRIHLSTRHVDTIHHFNTRSIRSLNISAPDVIWITTYDEGFFLYRNKRLTRFPLDREKYLSAAHCLVEGNNGNCWITTNKGLFQASREDLLAYADGEQSYVYYHYYGKDRGFNTNEFNGGCQPCAVKLPNGYISLPSLEGLVFFSAATVKPGLPGGELFIENAELNGNLMPWHDDTLALPHAFQQLKLHVSVPYFGDPYNLQLLYRLSGADGDTLWLPVTPDHTLSFSTLPSGTYELQVRKINGFGKNNYTDKILILTVAPAYYETWWFRLLVMLVLIICIVIYIRLHTRHIKQQNQVLESRVSARTSELESALASLSISEKKLRRQARTQERLLASITHDIKTPMKYLMMLAGNMSWKEEARMEPTMVARSSKAIYDASYRIYYLVDNLIQYIRTHVKNGAAQPEEVDLRELVEEKTDIFSSIAEANNTVVINNVPQELQFCANYQALAVVLHNLLDNAVKNTREGEIIISARHCVDKIVVSIEDTGTGLPPVLLHWINEYWHPMRKEDDASPAHNGLGLIIVMELLEQMKGRLKAENKPHCGAIVKIELTPC